MKYDIIGDIHGHVIPLIQLLQKLGYCYQNGFYKHPEGNKVIFVGDFIDRGPNIRETLQLVKAMTDNKTAEAIMGNHEYNAICFHLKDDKKGGYLREHNFKNIRQHQDTIEQFQLYEEEWTKWIDWFKTLPLFIEKENFRVVHACWDSELIAHLKTIAPENILSDKIIYESQEKGTPNYEAIERTLKGKEENLPDGLFFKDKDGAIRKEARIKWWMNPDGKKYDQFVFGDICELKGKDIPKGAFKNSCCYSPDDKPVFFGHYWLNHEPDKQTDNVVCLDYSIAKEGRLVAYQYNGEKILNKDNIKYVETDSDLFENKITP